MIHGSPLFISGSTRSGARWLTDRIGCEENVSPIYDADFVARLLWIFMVHTGEERNRMVARCMVDAVRAQEQAPKQSRLAHGSQHLHLERAAVALRTEELLCQLHCGLGILALREYIKDLFAAHTAIDGKTRWACNSALLVHMLPQLHSLFPDMRIVHVFRPGDELVPFADTFGTQFPGQYVRVDSANVRWQADEMVQSILAWSSRQNPRPVGASRRAA
jgi:hypothetical protein